MYIPPPLPAVPFEKKKPKGCLSCLIILGAGAVLLGFFIFLFPVLLRAMGVFGRSAQYLYQQAPDLVAGALLEEALEKRNIEGVSVYVIPIKNRDEKGAFIILDASKGYTGLSPLENDDAVFLDLLKDLTQRNLDENLRIAHLTVEYRDEEGKPLLSFTVDQKIVGQYANGTITQDEFHRSIHIDLMETMRRFGLDELLEESLQ